jgi:hypothetical protein
VTTPDPTVRSWPAAAPQRRRGAGPSSWTTRIANDAHLAKARIRTRRKTEGLKWNRAAEDSSTSWVATAGTEASLGAVISTSPRLRQCERACLSPPPLARRRRQTCLWHSASTE